MSEDQLQKISNESVVAGLRAHKSRSGLGSVREASQMNEEDEIREETRRESDRLEIRSKLLSWND